MVCSPLQKQVVGSSRVAFHCRLEEGGPRWAVFFLCPKLIGLAGDLRTYRMNVSALASGAVTTTAFCQ